MIERRRYRRLRDGVRVIYKMLGVMGEYDLPALDVGGGGLCLPLRKRIKIGTHLELGLFLPQDKEPFFCLARVVWQMPDPTKTKDGKDCYETGVEFLKLNLKDRMRIIRYIHRQIRESKDRTK